MYNFEVTHSLGLDGNGISTGSVLVANSVPVVEAL